MPQKLKILHLTASLAIGGAQRLILGLAEKTDRSKFEVHVYFFGKFQEKSFQAAFEALEDTQLVLCRTDHFYSLKTLRDIVDYIRQQKIDIVQTHMIDADIVGRIAARLAGVPVISTLQNEPRSYDSARFDRRWLGRWTARRLTTHSVAVSEHIRKLFIENWKIPEDIISTIYNAVALSNFLAIHSQSRAGTLTSGVTITNIASLTEQKAQHILLEAARLILREYPETHFLIVGQGVLDTSLKEKAQALGILDRITFTGVRHDIPDILATSDIFVLSSLWEGLPLAAIEAMAAACPVVLTDVGGNYELVTSGEHGLIVAPNDTLALAAGLLTLIENPAMRLSMGQAARERAVRQFGIQTITMQYETLYSNVWQDFCQPTREQ